MESAAGSEPKEVDLPGFRMAGLKTRTRNADEFDAAHSRIGKLWGAFMGGAGDRIPGVSEPDTIVAAYTGYASDYEGDYDFILGKPVSQEVEVFAPVVSLEVPRGRYLLFTAGGRSPEQIVAAWRAVYAYFEQPSAPKRAYTVDFERYDSSGVHLAIAI